MIFSSLLRKFRPEEPTPDPITDNTHGWIKLTGMDTVDGFKEMGAFDPDLLLSAVTRFLAGYPDCTVSKVSFYNGYLLISPADSTGAYMALSPIVEVDE